MRYTKVIRFNRIVVLGIGLILGVPQTRAAGGFDYLGPVEELDNGIVTLQVALHIGRVVSYHKKGQKNCLAVWDERSIPEWHWNPWGGDRIWPCAQQQFPEIYKNNGADPTIDGKPWTLIQKTPTSIEFKSQGSPELGIEITRRIELLPNSTEAVHQFQISRVKENMHPVHLWAITAVCYGDFILMESVPGKYSDGRPFKCWAEMSEALPQTIFMERYHALKVPFPAKPAKLGTYGRWIAQVTANRAFLQSIDYQPDQPYLDSSSLQVYLNPVTHIYEIETLSPAWFLKKGETRNWIAHWKIVELPKEAQSAEEKAGYIIRLLNRSND